MAEGWTVDQLKFQEWLATPRFTRTPPTQELFAAQLGVGDRTLTRWQALPGWQEAVNQLARASLGKKLPDLYGVLFREAEKGSFQHLQLAMEMTGEYVKKQHNINQGELKGDLTFRFVEEETPTDEGE